MARIKLAPKEWYTPYAIIQEQGFTLEQAKKEYQRLRHAAAERVRRLKAAGFDGKAAGIDLKALSARNSVELGHALADLRRFMGTQSTTVSGAKRERDRAIETYKSKWGVKGLNAGNYKKFIEALEKAREKHQINYVAVAAKQLARGRGRGRKVRYGGN